LQAQHEQMVAQLHEMAQEIETKKAEASAKLEIAQMQEETKRLIAQGQEATKLAIAQISTKAQDATRSSADALSVLEIQDAMDQRAHEAALATTQHAITAAGQLAGHEHASEQAAAGQQHAAGMQQQAQDAAAAQAEASAQAEPAAA
jgi:hypothetical protein